MTSDVRETALEQVESVEDRQVGRRYIRSGHRDGLNGARRESREQAALSILTPSYDTFTGADRRLEANQSVRARTCDLPLLSPLLLTLFYRNYTHSTCNWRSPVPQETE